MKKTYHDYVALINLKKQDAHAIHWLYIELNAQALVDELEPKVANVKTAALAMLDTMLEGDGFVAIPRVSNKLGKDLTVRYYCDNLSDTRRKYSEVNQ